MEFDSLLFEMIHYDILKSPGSILTASLGPALNRWVGASNTNLHFPFNVTFLNLSLNSIMHILCRPSMCISFHPLSIQGIHNEFPYTFQFNQFKKPVQSNVWTVQRYKPTFAAFLGTAIGNRYRWLTLDEYQYLQ